MIGNRLQLINPKCDNAASTWTEHDNIVLLKEESDCVLSNSVGRMPCHTFKNTTLLHERFPTVNSLAEAVLFGTTLGYDSYYTHCTAFTKTLTIA